MLLEVSTNMFETVMEWIICLRFAMLVQKVGHIVFPLFRVFSSLPFQRRG